jgi:hypothetical protein
MASLLPGYEYNIFISYRQKDNKGDRRVSEFVDALKGLRSLVYKFPGDVPEVETGESDILRDFDIYEDYKKELNQIQ